MCTMLDRTAEQFDVQPSLPSGVMAESVPNRTAGRYAAPPGSRRSLGRDRPCRGFKSLRASLAHDDMVGDFAEFERAMIRERTSAGLAAARAPRAARRPAQ